MEPTPVSGNAAKTAKKKPRGKPFVSGDPRANKGGQHNAASVAFSRSLREIIASVGNEEVKSDKGVHTRVELMVRGLYIKASKGDTAAFSALVERVEGKVLVTADFNLNHSGEMTVNAGFDLTRLSPAELDLMEELALRARPEKALPEKMV